MVGTGCRMRPRWRGSGRRALGLQHDRGMGMTSAMGLGRPGKDAAVFPAVTDCQPDQWPNGQRVGLMSCESGRSSLSLKATLSNLLFVRAFVPDPMEPFDRDLR